MLNYSELRTEYCIKRDNRPIGWFWPIAGILGIALVCGFLMTGCAAASERPYTDKQAILAIIGEAEGEGITGMTAVACAIRNRGTLQGVYGLHAPRIKQHQYTDSIYKIAVKAWEQSAYNDITHGATHWEGTKFKVPYWAKHMRVTATIGSQRFYKKG